MKKLSLILQFNYQLIIFVFVVLVYLIINNFVIESKSIYKGNEIFLEGVITNYHIDGNLVKIDFKTPEKIKASYYLKTIKEKQTLANDICLGCTLQVKGVLEKPLNNTIFNTFNYKKYLEHQKIYYLFKIKDYQIIKNNNIFYKIKDKVVKRIYSLEQKDYLLAFLIGDKALLNNNEYDLFKNNGIAHLLAISGMHIGFVISLCSFLLTKLKNKTKNLIISFILLFIGFLTSFSASVLRVIIFFILNWLNSFKKKPFSKLVILIYTLNFEILINPFIIYDYGFLYSNIITFGIIYFQEKIKGNYFKKLFSLSLICFLFSLPITARLNYEVNLTSILANLVFVPLVSFIIYPWSIISIIIPNPIYGFLIKIFNYLSIFFNYFKIVINIPKLSLILIIIYYLILLLSKNNLKLLLTLLVIIIINKLIFKLDRNYYVLFFDVGQGDSSIIISPYQKEVVMIDTGGKTSFKKLAWQERSKNYFISDNVLKYLKSRGITKINYLIISHGDSDHALDAVHIINNFKVKYVILNKGPYNNLEKAIIKTKVKLKNHLDLFLLKGINLNNKIYDNENDNSIVNYFIVGGIKFLYLGDASKKVEEDILNKYDLDIDIVKLGHHGSKFSTSKTLLRQPWQIGIISCGCNNIYNHPSLEVVLNLEKYHKKYWQTSRDGTISFKIRDKAYTIRTCLP